MRYLLDTNALLFSWLDSAQLSSRAYELIEAAENELFYSQASVWEISLKYSIGKLSLPAQPAEYVPACVRKMALERAMMVDEIIYASTQLPAHHKDPFDRILIATAQAAVMPIISSDGVFGAYEVEVIW